TSAGTPISRKRPRDSRGSTAADRARKSASTWRISTRRAIRQASGAYRQRCSDMPGGIARSACAISLAFDWPVLPAGSDGVITDIDSISDSQPPPHPPRLGEGMIKGAYFSLVMADKHDAVQTRGKSSKIGNQLLDHHEERRIVIQRRRYLARRECWHGEGSDACLVGGFKDRRGGVPDRLLACGRTERVRDDGVDDRPGSAGGQFTGGCDNGGTEDQRGMRHRLALDVLATFKPDQPRSPHSHHAATIGGSDDGIDLVGEQGIGGRDDNGASKTDARLAHHLTVF